ncbi:TetR/AcrR family transcriptional regulator [Rhodococcus opacus]|uniref:TetR/AcrR family transcriptional regulator n=1 Tax=Rhodococcus opacus TaxID=37919 RepID=UPI001C48A397|nr:TetR/AcrR family transcriptional regulator [Rhodococcus opacus]MBV6760220.1 TetR family transcriptional regulator [Rhodococcus opacus]
MVKRSAPVRESRRPGADGILTGALKAFYDIGYGGTSVREIANRADVTVAALYHHFESKQEILATVMRRGMEADLAAVEEAAQRASQEPVEQLRAIVAAHVRFHTVHKMEAFVGNYELRSLEPAARREVVELRDRHEQLFTRVIAEGIECGVFLVEDAQEASRAVLAMCTGVAMWYKRGGAVTVETLERRYADLALNTVRYAPPTSSQSSDTTSVTATA